MTHRRARGPGTRVLVLVAILALGFAAIGGLAPPIATAQATPPGSQPNHVRVLVEGPYAYLADAHGYPYTIVRVLDVADPAHPVQVGSYTSGVGEYVDLAV